jgi:hypothetical protein
MLVMGIDKGMEKMSFKAWLEAVAAVPNPQEMATKTMMKTAAARALAANGGKKQAVTAMKRTGAALMANPATDPNHVLKSLPNDEDDPTLQKKMMKK